MKEHCRFFIILFFASCSCESYYGYKDLGSNYYLYYEGTRTDIIHARDEKSGREGSGFPVIPARVTRVEFNERYIIALNEIYSTGTRNFWIIDKKKKELALANMDRREPYEKYWMAGVSGPMDLTSFYAELKKKNIKLRFKSSTDN